MTNEVPVAETPANRDRVARRRGLAILIALAIAATVAVVVVAARTSGKGAPAGQTRGPEDSIVDIRWKLEAQAKAYVTGDQKGWLAPVLPDSGAEATFRNLYAKLRRFGVTSVGEALDYASGLMLLRSDPKFPVLVTVYFGFCAQTITCPTVTADHNPLSLYATESFSARTRWIKVDGVYLIDDVTVMGQLSKLSEAPPWIDMDMKLTVGRRVLVAASADLASRLPETSDAAEAAAAIADRYAQWVRPTRYVVYLANEEQWENWYGGSKLPIDKEILGYAVATSFSSDVVVLHLAAIDSGSTPLSAVLRHEFGHVVTVLGAEDNVFTEAATKPYREGIAEYIEQDHRPLSTYPRLPALRRFIQSRRWKGRMEEVFALDGGDLEQLNEMYAMGYLLWRCVADRFGEPKMLDFMGHVVRGHDEIDDDAKLVLGTTWSAVERTCADYIRAAAR